jgi:predicted RNA-binding Zn-ribbon protein involved in translation (DUF1610 family)
VASSFASVVLKCAKCGKEQTIRRKKSNLHKKGHVKHLFCVECGKRTKHTEGDVQ